MVCRQLQNLISNIEKILDDIQQVPRMVMYVDQVLSVALFSLCLQSGLLLIDGVNGLDLLTLFMCFTTVWRYFE